MYFPGCTSYFKFKENFELYKRIFLRLGIGFREIDKKVCCGIHALEGGYEQESRKLARKNFETFKEENIQSIITTEPSCYKMFLQNYPEFLPDWNIKVKNIWEIILDKLEKNPKLIKYKSMKTIGYHDSCYLGRYCGIYEAPRRILELIGYEIKEMGDSKENAVCCGSCGGLVITNNELADKIAKARILQAKREGIKILIVSSLDNYSLLKKNSEDEGVEILELSEVLAIALSIKVKDKKIEEYISGEEKILLEAGADMDMGERLKGRR